MTKVTKVTNELKQKIDSVSGSNEVTDQEKKLRKMSSKINVLDTCGNTDANSIVINSSVGGVSAVILSVGVALTLASSPIVKTLGIMITTIGSACFLGALTSSIGECVGCEPIPRY